jgi:hypothetical protein
MSAEATKINDRRAMTVLAEQPTTTAVATQPVTPMQMLAQAFQQGMPIETIRELRQIQKEWEADEARKAFDAAVADAKAKIKPILKNREVDFTNKNGGGRTNYEYEDFGAIADHVDPILAEYGLSYRHRPKQEGKELTITCILSHRDGHREETSLKALNDESGNKNGIQGIGSTATFLQRYTLKLALGLATTRDDDGHGAGEPTTGTGKPTAPADYKDWQTHMETTAKSGITKLQDAWGKTAQELRDFATQHDVTWWKNTKSVASKVQP